MSIDCLATGSRPEPEFLWYIGNKLYEQNHENITISIEELEDGRATYTSTFNYYGKSEDNGQIMKCEVNHTGYQR